MKKIVFVLPNMALGGTEKSLLSLLDTLSQEEYDVTLLLFKQEGLLLDQVPSWVKVKGVSDFNEMNYDFSKSPFKLFPEYVKRKKLIRAFNIIARHIWFRLTNNRYSYYYYVLKDYRFDESFDIAVAYLGPYDLLTAYVLFCIRAKEKIQWIHFDVSKYVFNKHTSKSFYKRYNRINVVSGAAKDALLDIIPELESKSFVTQNVVSKKRCQQLADSETGFVDDFSGLRIITVGRLSEEKGQDIIPQIADQLKSRNVRFRWYIIGEGLLKEQIIELISRYGVDDCVFLLGAKENPYPFFKEADIYVQTSKHEGYGLVLAEAKVFDLSIVATRCSATDEILDGVSNAIIIDRKADEFVNAIISTEGKLNNA